MESPRYLAVGDARRGAFYFSAVENGVCLEGPKIATEEEVREAVGRFGAWPLYTCESIEPFSTAEVVLPSAAILGSLAEDGRGIVQAGNLEPIYLREPYITQPKSRHGLPPQGGFVLE